MTCGALFGPAHGGFKHDDREEGLRVKPLLRGCSASSLSLVVAEGTGSGARSGGRVSAKLPGLRLAADATTRPRGFAAPRTVNTDRIRSSAPRATVRRSLNARTPMAKKLPTLSIKYLHTLHSPFTGKAAETENGPTLATSRCSSCTTELPGNTDTCRSDCSPL
jgi:hypothetical protein